VRLHKVVSPERDVVRGLARLEAFVEPDAYMYFQDVGDHLARLGDTIDTYREVANGTMDIYLSVQSNRLNGIMKQLTVVATIFMPLTLISGIYGMNVLKGMWPPASAGWSFAAIIGAMVLIAVWMVLFFRRRDWW
jgi:magnesium transporter